MSCDRKKSSSWDFPLEFLGLPATRNENCLFRSRVISELPIPIPQIHPTRCLCKAPHLIAAKFIDPDPGPKDPAPGGTERNSVPMLSAVGMAA